MKGALLLLLVAAGVGGGIYAATKKDEKEVEETPTGRLPAPPVARPGGPLPGDPGVIDDPDAPSISDIDPSTIMTAMGYRKKAYPMVQQPSVPMTSSGAKLRAANAMRRKTISTYATAVESAGGCKGCGE